jgi:hypothetical protein
LSAIVFERTDIAMEAGGFFNHFLLEGSKFKLGRRISFYALWRFTSGSPDRLEDKYIGTGGGTR